VGFKEEYKQYIHALSKELFWYLYKGKSQISDELRAAIPGLPVAAIAGDIKDAFRENCMDYVL
jgi:hypothetical protein